LPFGAVAVAALAVGGGAGAGGPVGPDVVSRLLCYPRLAWHWAGHLLLVSRPVPFYPWPPPDAWPAALLRGLPLLLAGVAVTVLAIRRRWTRAGPALVAVAILSLPAAGVVFGPRDFITADRYAYLPLVAFAAAAAFGLAALRPGVRWGVSAAVMAGCLALSVPAVGVWADSDAIFARVLAVYPGQRSIRLNRANVLAESGRTREALAEYRRLLDGHEDDVVVLVCLARCQFDAKDYPAAIRIATRIAELEPGNPTHCLRAGYTCRVAGRPDEAVRWDRRALRIAPGDPVAVAELAEILMASDLEALRRDPEDVPALMKVGLFYAREGDRRDAISYLGRAAALPSPQRADCWYFLGRLHYDLGELDRARRALDLALQLAPDHEAARRLRAELR
jgi:Flp pilus assembly protein TadD